MWLGLVMGSVATLGIAFGVVAALDARYVIRRENDAHMKAVTDTLVEIKDTLRDLRRD